MQFLISFPHYQSHHHVYHEILTNSDLKIISTRSIFALLWPIEVSVSRQNCAVTFGLSNYFLCFTYAIIVSHQSFAFTPGQPGHFQGSTHVKVLAAKVAQTFLVGLPSWCTASLSDTPWATQCWHPHENDSKFTGCWTRQEIHEKRQNTPKTCPI